MKRFVRFTLAILLFGCVVFPAPAAFTSFYVFGDGACTTTNNPSPGPYFYGKRYTNGRVWVEVLAQRQGLSSDTNKNWSYFGQDSGSLVTNINRFTAPADVNTALFAVWVNDADFVYDASNYGMNLTLWTTAINLSLTNHLKALQALYAKGARSLVLPNAVDISKVPYYAGLSAANKTFIRQRVIDFNAGFAVVLNQARAALSGITIYAPDFFTLLDNLLAHSSDYGLTNAGIDALDDDSLTDKSLNGPGAIYIFWDYLDPTAKAHEVMADVAQQAVAPVRISKLTLLNGSNRLDVANVPVGLNGFVYGSTNLTNWASVQNISSTNTTVTVFVPTAVSPRFYRLRFPYAWSWP